MADAIARPLKLRTGGQIAHHRRSHNGLLSSHSGLPNSLGRRTVLRPQAPQGPIAHSPLRRGITGASAHHLSRIRVVRCPMLGSLRRLPTPPSPLAQMHPYSQCSSLSTRMVRMCSGWFLGLSWGSVSITRLTIGCIQRQRASHGDGTAVRTSQQRLQLLRPAYHSHDDQVGTRRSLDPLGVCSADP